MDVHGHEMVKNAHPSFLPRNSKGDVHAYIFSIRVGQGDGNGSIFTYGYLLPALEYNGEQLCITEALAGVLFLIVT